MKIERGYPIYTVTPKAENAIVKGHPWVYDAEILNTEGETTNGGLVDIVSKKGRYLGTGFLSERPKIRVRLISATPMTALTPPSGTGSSNGHGSIANPSWTRRTWTPAASFSVRRTPSPA